jgi:DNA polymerase III epsilon subunit-like protein
MFNGPDFFILLIIVAVIIVVVIYEHNNSSSSAPIPDNMRIMVFDVETSGLSPYDNEILQLSYVILEKDWHIYKQINHFFPYPPESRVEMEAIIVNGLNQYVLEQKELSDKKEALALFYNDMKECNVAVAHNASFDISFIDETAKREKVKHREWVFIYDTMKETTNLCRIPHPYWYNHYKYPKLEELGSFLNVNMGNYRQHDSLDDVKVTLECVKRLAQRGVFQFAKYKENALSGIRLCNVSGEMGADITYMDYIGKKRMKVNLPIKDLIINNQSLNTYRFYQKRVAVVGVTKDVKKIVEKILITIGAIPTQFLIRDEVVCADSVIIGKAFDARYKTKFPQVVSLKKEFHDSFMIFAVEAFMERYEMMNDDCFSLS